MEKSYIKHFSWIIRNIYGLCTIAIKAAILNLMDQSDEGPMQELPVFYRCISRELIFFPHHFYSIKRISYIAQKEKKRHAKRSDWDFTKSDIYFPIFDNRKKRETEKEETTTPDYQGPEASPG